VLNNQTPNKMEKQAMNLINLYNEKGQKHGYWESYYKNGQLLSKGSFLNGKRHGDWEYYWDNGQLDYKKTYDNGKGVKEITELTLEDIANKFGISVNNLKIKK